MLLGADTEMIRRCRHQQLSTYGLLKEHGKKEVQGWIYQLLDQGLVGRSEGDYPVLRLNEQSWAVMRGQTTVRLLRAKKGRRERTRYEEQSWENADRGLFDRLREWRREAAATRGVPPFVILHDTALQQMSIVRPTSVETLRQVRGIGERRAADLGPELTAIIEAYCREHGVTCDVAAVATGPEPPRPPSRAAPIKEQAFALFAQGHGIDQVAQAIGRARSTTCGYLADYVAERRPERINAWVDDSTYLRVAVAAAASEDGRLKPLFDQLNGEVPYEMLRLIVAHLQVTGGLPQNDS